MIPISKPYIGEEEKKAVLDVLDSGLIVQGPQTEKIEKKFAELCDVQFAVATTSGTTALHLAMLANNIGPGDEVITTPFSFIATVNSILFVGAKPVFIDIDEDSFNINANLIEEKINDKTKAIVPVHLYGQMCNMDKIQELADKYRLAIIEDACQAVGATYRGKYAGSYGTGAFSLYATKNIAAGEGGIITTNNQEIAEKCRMLRNHGMQIRYHHDFLGYNFRMTDINAAIGLSQIERLAFFTKKRQQNAAYLSSHLSTVIRPTVQDSCIHVWHQYTIRIKDGRDRDLAVRELNEAGIGTGVFYPIPLHQQKHIKDSVGKISCPVAEKLAKEVISLPVHPQLKDAELNKIAQEVNRIC
ncbi:MAG: DegT/DnrJ/EryC1/StrS family aminotransferase [Bacteroidales bacterium]|nr:DegT/DnrJ/EryC1/StrS family aminotransferase [Bacteroidales bacterium]